MSRIIVLGSGGFGLAVAIACDSKGHEVTVWSKFQDEIDAIKRTGELKAKLPGIKVPGSIKLTTDISETAGKDIVILGIPTAFSRSVCEMAAQYADPSAIIVNTAKGLEEGTLKTMYDVTKESMPDNPVCILTGPSHAEELARGIPTTIVAAADSKEVALFIQDALSSGNFRIYLSDDILGCELGGALKNVIALAAGVCDGLGLGDNTKAALMTRGINEIAALGVKMGAKRETFAGLSGIGDMIVTCCSMHSRNRRAGILIGQGVSPEDAVSRVGTVEGYLCTRNAHELAKREGVEMPISEQLYSLLFEGADVKDSIAALMNRPNKQESESKFLGTK